MTYKATILVVDDDEMIRRLVEGVLEEKYEVVLCESGEEALDSVHQVCPDIILLDMQMPGLDGLQTCERLKEDVSTTMIPVIFMSSMEADYEKEEAYRVGGEDVMLKPVDVLELLSLVDVTMTLQNQSAESRY